MSEARSDQYARTTTRVVDSMPVDNRRASDIAYMALRGMILDLTLPPGALVNEKELAASLSLGRMPVREALARLAADRFIVVLPRRGTVIASLAFDDVLVMFEAREALECGIAHVAARRASDEALAQLRLRVEATEVSRRSSDPQQFLSEDYEIHVSLAQMVGNALLQDAAKLLLLHNVRFWNSYFACRPAEKGRMVSHGDLLQALLARDAQGAEEAMRAHITASRQLLQALF